MSAFRTIVNKLFKKNDVTFIGNIKKCLKNEFFFFFSHKKFLKIFLKSIILWHPLTFLVVLYKDEK